MNVKITILEATLKTVFVGSRPNMFAKSVRPIAFSSYMIAISK